MRTTEQLTYIQKVALEGEISLALCTSRHNAEMLYRIYTIFKEAPEAFREYILDVLQESTSVPTEVLSKILIEVNLETVPVWIWIDRCIADLLESINILEQQSLTISDNDLCIDKRETKRKVIKSAFTLFCRKVYTVSPEAARILLQSILAENRLDFLHIVCFSILNMKQLKEKRTDIPAQILSVIFDIREILSFTREKTQERKKKVKKEDEGSVSLDELRDKVISKVVSKATKGKVKKEDIIECAPIYKVIKTYKSTNVATTLRTFSSREEAVNFVETIKKRFPDVLDTCKFTLVRERRLNGYN